MEGLKYSLNQLAKSIGRTKLFDESESRESVLSKLLPRYSLCDILNVINQTTKDETIAYLSVACEIVLSSSDEWLTATIPKTQSLNESFCKVVANSYVPTFRDMEHYEFDENDFLGVAELANAVMNFTLTLMTRLKPSSKESSIQNFICHVTPDITILVVEHLQANLWTGTRSVLTANKLLSVMMEMLNVENECDLLQCHMTTRENQTSQNVTMLCHILKIITKKLKRENWKKTPSMKHVFSFCVSNTKFPCMSQYLDRILPPALLFVDDYVIENKVMGVNCLSCIVDCVSAEEFRWYGRAEVVYEALRHQLYTREPQLLEVTVPALLAILKVVEKPNKDADSMSIRQLTRYDEIFQQLIQDALGESVLSLHRIYTKYLDIFVDIMGITSVRHLKQILELVENYLEIYDGPEEQARQNVLNLLRKVIEVAWPRIPRYMGKILKFLVKFLCDLHIDNTVITDEVKSQLTQDAQLILMLLKSVDEQEVLTLLSSLKDVDLPVPCKQVITVVTSAETLTL